MAQKKNNSGALFRNKDYEEGGNKPMYTGPCMVDGVEKRMAAWLNEKDGVKYMSLQFSDPKSQNDRSSSRSSGGSSRSDDVF